MAFVEAAQALYQWYKSHGRNLIFRETKEPYPIWVAEIVFQQTRIAQGMQHYINFLHSFPTIKTLAEAGEDELMLSWKGLGYYTRAINIRKAAQKIMEQHHGIFPTDFNEILKLPGIGNYTAAAISSICFNIQKIAVDGNFYRVFSRYYKDDTDISGAKAFTYFENLALPFLEKFPGTAGDFNQAIMDIGSQICLPKNPKCTICPLNKNCQAYREGIQSQFPVKKSKVKVLHAELFYEFCYNQNHFIAKKRNQEGIWKNLFEFLPISEDQWNHFCQNSPSIIFHHKLTHRNLTIKIAVHRVSENEFKSMVKKEGNIKMAFHNTSSIAFAKPFTQFLAYFDAFGNPKTLFLPND